MRKTLLILLVVAGMASCATHKPLYYWGDYNMTSYNYLKNSNDAATSQLMATYEKIIASQTALGARGVVPPGVYADYGFILIQADRTVQGKAMLEKEIELYPESKIFIDRILNMLER